MFDERVLNQDVINKLDEETVNELLEMLADLR